jgi:membrane protease subunit HflK
MQMAWNEPGGGKRDPWQKPRQNDVDAWLRRLKDGVAKIFGGGGAGGGGAPSSGGGFGSIALIVVAVILIWAGLSSWTKIDARQLGVVLRFGQFNRTMSSGLNFKWPSPFEQVIAVDATSVKNFTDQVRMLTKDENIVVIDFNVQYTVSDARQYLFSANAPDEALKQAAESALRQVIGRSEMDAILTGQGTELASETEKLLKETLTSYKVGLLVNKVNFQKIQPPSEVKQAFDDANNAGNNQQQFINDALAYGAKVVPEARGDAARIRAAAEGYKSEQIANATGETQRFSLIEQQYKAAPDVTRKRLYLETMQSVLANSSKVIDGTNGKNLLYLPIDRIKDDPNAAAAAAALRNHRENDQ